MIPLLLAALVTVQVPASDAVLTVDVVAPASGGAATVTAIHVGSRRFPLTVFPDGIRRRVSILLTGIPAGRHEVSATAPVKLDSASVREVMAADSDFLAIRHSPFVSPRAGTIAANSDLPLLVYCERLVENGVTVLQYTVIFSNEDGGTSTRALMARWGRTTDIEYVYRVFLDGKGQAVKRTYQGKDHVDTAFTGPFEGDHALLLVTTRNNMVAGGDSPDRFQLVPRVVDLTGRSRESVMDAEPWTYQVMNAELEAEKKLRPYGKVDGENISDIRNYFFIDFGVERTAGAAIAVRARRRGDAVEYSSQLGRTDYAIDRDGQVRSTVELPPGTNLADIESIGFECVLVPDKARWPHSGACQVKGVAKAFFLDRTFQPPATFFRSAVTLRIPSGQTHYIPVKP